MKRIVGWVAIAVIFGLVGFWTWWGINENFHEGWYHQSVWQNLVLLCAQYLSVPLLVLGLTFFAIRYKNIGLGLFILLGLFSLYFFDSNAGRTLVALPLILLALGFYYGEFVHTKIILRVLIGMFLLIVLGFGIPQLIRVETRFNDGDFGTRIIEGNEVRLTWAPQGIGFPLEGTDWHTANARCQRLNQEGTRLEEEKVQIWRLPTKEELIRSLTRDGVHVEGVLVDSETARYAMAPDKETPLWNPHSQIIYYWTSDQKNAERAYMVAYNGFVLNRSIESGAGYHGYRCVREDRMQKSE